MAALGVFSLAFVKPAGHYYLMFTTADGRQLTHPVNPRLFNTATRWCAQFNLASTDLAA